MWEFKYNEKYMYYVLLLNIVEWLKKEWLGGPLGVAL